MSILQDNQYLLTNFKNKISELISTKSELSILYLKHNLKSELNSLNFKIRSYNKWNLIIHELIKNITILIDNGTLSQDINPDIYKVSLKDAKNIRSLKLTLGLQKKLIEFGETNQIEDIEKTRQDIIKYSDASGLNVENVSISNLNTSSITLENNTIDSSSISRTNKIDTSKIEAIPKNMAHEARPNDKIGGMIYDLKLVTGIGGSNAKKLAEAAGGDVLSAHKILCWFVLVGWAIYPVGYMAGTEGWYSGIFGGLDMDVIYNIGDAINKIGFGLVIYSLAVKKQA